MLRCFSSDRNTLVLKNMLAIIASLVVILTLELRMVVDM